MNLVCARDGCDEPFQPKTHNQKYHNNECCKIATNARIMEKYYEKRDMRLGKPRWCSECKQTKLSRYNPKKICSACEAKKTEERSAGLKEMLSSTVIV